MRFLSAALCIFILTATSPPASGNSFGGIVIDPGHSPKSPGATSSAGKGEHLYNFTLAKAVSEYLAKRGIKAALTRKADEAPTLKARALSSTGGALLISIHHDSVQPRFIAWTNGRPSSIKAEGYSIFLSSKNRHFVKSLEYARRLGAALRSRELKPSVHHGERIPGENRQLVDRIFGIYLNDNLAVLNNADIPAILLEAAVIVNPHGEAAASSSAYRSKIAEAIAEAYSGEKRDYSQASGLHR